MQGKSKGDYGDSLNLIWRGHVLDLNRDNASQQTHSNAGQPLSRGRILRGRGNSIVCLEITTMRVTEKESHNDTSAAIWLVSLAMWRAFLDLGKTEFEDLA